MKRNLLPLIYLFTLAAECFAVFTGDFQTQIFTKTALMPLLMIYFFLNSGSLPPLKFSIFAALFCSWLGDVALLFDRRFGDFFVVGLVSFLVAHLCYIFYFWRVKKLNAAEKGVQAKVLLGVSAYLAIFYAALFPFLGALRIPVAIYGAVISLMLIVSFHAFASFKKDFAKICLAGTILFVASDSLLALNRFAFPFALAPVLVMLTYGLAQLLITEGSLRNLREIAEKKF